MRRLAGRIIGSGAGSLVTALATLAVLGAVATLATAVWDGWALGAVLTGVNLMAVGVLVVSLLLVERRLSRLLRAQLDGHGRRLDRHEERLVRYLDAGRARVERMLQSHRVQPVSSDSGTSP